MDIYAVLTVAGYLDIKRKMKGIVIVLYVLLIFYFCLFCLSIYFRLFFGGYYRIKIESIRIRTTRQNFKTFIYSLWCFDTMITGGKPPKKVSKDDIFIISSLMSNFLGKPTTKQFDDYIYSK